MRTFKLFLVKCIEWSLLFLLFYLLNGPEYRTSLAESPFYQFSKASLFLNFVLLDTLTHDARHRFIMRLPLLLGMKPRVQADNGNET